MHALIVSVAGVEGPIVLRYQSRGNAKQKLITTLQKLSSMGAWNGIDDDYGNELCCRQSSVIAIHLVTDEEDKREEAETGGQGAAPGNPAWRDRNQQTDPG